ncbi:MAG TPA: glycosyltransferase [Acidimicrobiales bacterium]|nr:glycosyltransferase [Acidimicrobiales bacterium]
MRALWVTAEEPNRARGGGNIRQAHIVEALAGAVETHLLLLGPLRDAVLPDVLAGVTEVPVPERNPAAPTSRRVTAVAWGIAGRQPEELIVTRAKRAALAPVLAELAPQFDVICLEHLHLAPLIPPRPHHGRWLLTIQNVPSTFAAHAHAIVPGRRHRWLWERERRKAVRAEKAAAAAADTLIAVSDEDAVVLGADAVVPNGVDVDHYAPTPIPSAPRLVVTGTLAFLPNVDGLVWFCDNVFPRVQREVPDVSLDIVGRDAVPAVKALADRPGIRMHHDVPAIQPFIDAARVALVPVRIGSGTRVKALEAMASGRPVVGTTIGLEGLGVIDGEHAMVRDDPAEMAAAIVTLLRDDATAARIAAAARRHVEARFTWTRIGADFVSVVRDEHR